MYFGWMTRIWLSRYGVHFWISSGKGSRFLGGLHFKMLPMKTLCLANPISDSSVSRNFPAAPTNGFPLMSSQYPGASPITMIWLSGLPSPGTAFLRVFQSSHLRQTMTLAAIASKNSFSDKRASLTDFFFLSILISISSNYGSFYAVSIESILKPYTENML